MGTGAFSSEKSSWEVIPLHCDGQSLPGGRKFPRKNPSPQVRRQINDVTGVVQGAASQFELAYWLDSAPHVLLPLSDSSASDVRFFDGQHLHSARKTDTTRSRTATAHGTGQHMGWAQVVWHAGGVQGASGRKKYRETHIMVTANIATKKLMWHIRSRSSFFMVIPLPVKAEATLVLLVA